MKNNLIKKLAFAAMAAVAAATMCACGNSAPVNEAVNASKAEKIENMSVEAAAGIYTLSDMTEFGKTNKINASSYEENIIILEEDGKVTVMVKSGNQEETVSGTYTVTNDGIVTLDGVDLVSADEQIICNGKQIVVTGKLGTQLNINMVYKKANK